MYRRILVAIEHSPADDTIITHVAALAKATGAALVLVHVADGFAARHFDDLKLRESEEMMKDREYLEGLRKDLEGRGLTVSIELAKGDRLTDWTKRPLTNDQCVYAAGDVEHLLEITLRLRTELRDVGRLDWAELECEERRLRDRDRPDPRTAWWKIKGNRQLKAKSRGVAQEVAAWRERRAAELDQPTRFILSDLAMAGIKEDLRGGEWEDNAKQQQDCEVAD